jgi:peptidase M23-like protein
MAEHVATAPTTASPARATVATSTGNIALALVATLAFGVTYLLSLWIYVALLGPPAVALATAVARLWRARRGELEYGLLRNPLRAELRPHFAQAMLQLAFLLLLCGVMVAGTLGALDVLLSDGETNALRAGFWASVAVLAVAALVPRRRIFIPTNILVMLGVLFLLLQLARIHLPPRDPVTIDMPFAGEWYVFSGGRSVFVNEHWSTSSQRHALDIIKVVDGSSYRGDKTKLTSYYAFGKTLVAPAAGRMTAVVDTRPDLAIGDSDLDRPQGNYLVMDIGNGRYVMMGHLQRGSVQVEVGDRVRAGQPLARVGNSGNTSEPHLHIQVQNRPGFAVDQVGLRTYPILFRDTLLVRGGEVTRGDADTRRDDRIRGP